MTETKRFLIDDAGELIDLNNHKFIDYGDECCKLLNEQHEQIERLKENFRALDEVKCELADENEHYKSIFFELVETALTDKNCRELYCKGILDIFNKANSLNQAREMIKEHLE